MSIFAAPVTMYVNVIFVVVRCMWCCCLGEKLEFHLLRFDEILRVYKKEM